MLSALEFVTALDGREVPSSKMDGIWGYLQRRGCRRTVLSDGREAWISNTGYNLIFGFRHGSW